MCKHNMNNTIYYSVQVHFSGFGIRICLLSDYAYKPHQFSQREGGVQKRKNGIRNFLAKRNEKKTIAPPIEREGKSEVC